VNSLPLQRPRRLRRSPVIRATVRETRVDPDQLMMPHFVLPLASGREPIDSMPGIERLGTETLLAQVEEDLRLGIRSVMLFGLAAAEHKDAVGSAGSDSSGSQAEAVRKLKAEFGDDLLVVTDVCLCGYTDHGHCGIVSGETVVNDASVARLVDVALAHAEAGADMVAPSDMMDGRVGAIRRALDERGLVETGILAYSAKYASAYYGPFRDAADSAPQFGDRRSYQMDPPNVREALREVRLDEAEGADMVMVKPALAYLDVIRAVRTVTDLPLAAYNVSGEYSAVKAAAERGWLDEGAVVRENLVAMRRAGADILITYHARKALQEGWL